MSLLDFQNNVILLIILIKNLYLFNTTCIIPLLFCIFSQTAVFLSEAFVRYVYAIYTKFVEFANWDTLSTSL